MLLSESAWSYAVRFHGHACPGLAMGAAMTISAVRALELDASFLASGDFSGGRNFCNEEELVCVAETDACSLDAIQALLGCTMGKGNLILKMRGKNAFSFHHRPTGRAVRIVWAAPSAEMDREARIRHFLDSGASLCSVRNIPYQPPEEALISPSVPCAACGELTAETQLRLRGGKLFCLDCFKNPARFLP